MRKFNVNIRPLIAVVLLVCVAATSHVMWGQESGEEQTAPPVIEIRNAGYNLLYFDYDNLQEVLREFYFLSIQPQEDGCEIYYRLTYHKPAGENMLDWMGWYYDEMNLMEWDSDVNTYQVTVEAYAVAPGKEPSDIVSSGAYISTMTVSPWGIQYNENAFEVGGIYYEINENDSTTVSVTYDKYTYDPEPSNVSHHITYHGMSEITIPEQVTYNGNTYRVTGIGPMTFNKDRDLERINLPSTLEFIADDAFYWCDNLEVINIADVSQWCELDIDMPNYYYNPLYYARHLYLNGEEIRDLVIPEGIERLRDYACAYCNSLRSVTIPDMKAIGEHAFTSCSNLSRLNIGRVDSICNLAFSDCWALREVHATSLEAWCNIEFDCSGYYGIYTQPLYIYRRFYIGDEEIHDLSIPDEIRSLNLYAFAGCQSFTSLDLTGRTQGERIHLGSYSFYDCTQLKTAHIDHAIISNAFEGCTSLEEVTIGDDMGGLGSYAFLNCTALKTVKIGDGIIENQDGYEYNTGLYQIGDNAFSGCTNLTTVVIGACVQSIYNNAFKQCNKIKTLECHAIVPPAINDANAFTTTCYQNANLFVPRESIEAYQTAECWKDFSHIYAMESIGDANGDGRLSINDVTLLISSMLSNNTSSLEAALVDVNGDGIINISDVTALINKLLTGTNP